MIKDYSVTKFNTGFVFNATFNNISLISSRPVLLVEETGVPGENHQTVTSHWGGFKLTTLVVIGTDYKSNYHTIMTGPLIKLNKEEV